MLKTLLPAVKHLHTERKVRDYVRDYLPDNRYKNVDKSLKTFVLSRTPGQFSYIIFMSADWYLRIKKV